MPLLEDFLKRPFIDVVGVADVDPASPGALLAKGNGVFFTTDALTSPPKGDEIDVLIEVSGDARVKRRLKNALVAEGNRHTIIVHDLIARMMLSMSQDSPTLMRHVPSRRRRSAGSLRVVLEPRDREVKLCTLLDVPRRRRRHARPRGAASCSSATPSQGDGLAERAYDVVPVVDVRAATPARSVDLVVGRTQRLAARPPSSARARPRRG